MQFSTTVLLNQNGEDQEFDVTVFFTPERLEVAEGGPGVSIYIDQVITSTGQDIVSALTKDDLSLLRSEAERQLHYQESLVARIDEALR